MVKTLKCKNSDRKSVVLFPNGDRIIAMAMQEDNEYWFTIGTYKKESTAIRIASKVMARYGYIF